MAVNKNNENAKLIINVKIAEDEEKQRTFANLNPTVSDEDAYAVGEAIGKLQKYEIVAVKRQDLVKLANE